MYKRWRVYSTFITGLCIGLAYALLLGTPFVFGSAGLLDWEVLVLAFSGILGGVIYTIVINGEVEMPRFVVDRGALFKAGLFGDILLGISGAFILELLLPASLSGIDAEDPTGSAIAATGIIGGYGGRAIIKFSLERFFKYAGGLDEVRAAAITGQATTSQAAPLTRREQAAPRAAFPKEDPSASPGAEGITGGATTECTADEHVLALIEQADRYIQGGLPKSEWVRLTQQMQAEPASVHQAVAVALADLRMAMGDELSNEQLQRMGVLFNGLTGLLPDTHQNYYHLAMVNKELTPPAYDQALTALDKAIALRGPLSIEQSSGTSSINDPWQYELNRAIVNIDQGQAATEDFTIAAATQDAILADLLAIAKVYNLDTILQAADKQQIPIPVVNWIRHNQDLIAEREETRPLMNSLRSMIVGNRLRPIGTAPTGSITENPDSSQDAVFPEIFSALGRCYDILYLDPFNILSDNSAKITQVFDFYPQEAITAIDEAKTLPIPKGTRYTPSSTGRMEVSEQTNLLYTESDVQKMFAGTLFAGTLGGALTQLLGAVLPFSLSASYASYKSERTAQKSVYAFTKAEYVHYTLAFDRQQSATFHLNETFRQAVAQLPLTTTYEYLNFINDFGTHTAIQVQFGGLFHHRYCLKQSSYSKVVQSGGNVALEAKRAFEATYEKKNQGSTFKEFSDSHEVFDFCGGTKKENIHDWFPTIKADPAPIHLELMPLYELLTSEYFPEDEQIVKKRSLLTLAIQRYLEENSQPVPWELWSSATVGGNGGKTFSDMDLAPIALPINQERYQHARVKEVRVWIDKWVEQVQMVLDGDVPPLPAHGDEEGELHTLKLDPDDYITAVSIMPGAPKRIIRDRGPYVGSIRVRTHKQQDWTVGIPDSRAIELDIPQGYQAIGFHGRCGKRIDQLGVISIPVIDQTPH